MNGFYSKRFYAAIFLVICALVGSTLVGLELSLGLGLGSWFRPAWFSPSPELKPQLKPQGSQEMASWFYGEHDLVQIAIEGGEGVNKRYNKPFNPSLYPLSAVGLIRMDEEVCTGFLVGPREVLTAAHCVINEITLEPYESITISLNPFGHRVDGPTYSLTPVFGGEIRSEENVLPNRDWYLLRSHENIGKTFGWLGLKNSKGDTLPPSKKITSQAREELKPYLNTSSDVLKKIKELHPPWLLKKDDLIANNQNTRIISPGFLVANATEQFVLNTQIIKFPMSISFNCHIRALGEGLVIDDCSSSGGGSGGPLLEITDGNTYAIAVRASVNRTIELFEKSLQNQEVYQQLLTTFSDLENGQQPTTEMREDLTQNNIHLSTPTSKGEVLSHIANVGRDGRIIDSTPEFFKYTFWGEDGDPEHNHANISVPTDKFFEKVRDYLQKTYNR